MTRAEEKDMHDKDKKRKIPEDDLDDKAVFQFTDNSHLERKRFLVKWLLVGCLLLILVIIMLAEYLFGN